MGTEASGHGRATKGGSRQFYSYPTGVVNQEGHYIIFKIFEKEPVEYESPYVQIDQPTQLVNSLLTGLRGALTSKINAIRNKLEKAISKTASGRALTGNFKNSLKTSFERKKRIFTAWGQKGAAAKDKNVGNICLYVPPTVSVQHKMNYEEADITPIGGILKAITNLKHIGSEYKTNAKEAWNVIKAAAQGSVKFTGTGALGQSITGMAINQTFADVIFTGVAYRSFTFEYSFMPANAREAEEVHDIINTLTYYAMPLRKEDVAMTYELPAVFEMEYMYRDRVNQYIAPSLSLGLESVDIKYGGEKFVTFRGNPKGAQPVKTDVVLTFKELEIADRASIYGDVPPLGYDYAAKLRKDVEETGETEVNSVE
jgi:hypothetical protein